MQAEAGTSEQLQALMQEAVAAHQRGDFTGAEARYRKVLRHSPAHADATHFLGLLAHQTGHDEAALDLLRHSIDLGPTSPLYRLNLGGVYKELSRYAEAEACFREALVLKPDYAEAYLNLGLTQAARGEYAEALRSYEHALDIDAQHYQAWLSRGQALHELVRDVEAVEAYGRARELAASDAAKLQSVGLALREAGAVRKALVCFEVALKCDPGSAEIHNSLGAALGDLGNFNEAEKQYREALRLQPHYAGAWHNLSQVTGLVSDDPLWPAFETAAAHLDTLKPEDAAKMYFTLGKVRDDAQDFDRAFLNWLEGNRLKRAGIEYDEERQEHFFRNFIRHFDSGFMTRNADTGVKDARPVFIVGMSRSGTTLVEQILASHPQVHGAGEIQALRRCARVELGTDEDDDTLPIRLAALEPGGLARIGARYVTCLDALAPDSARITDKLPGNMALVGLIHLALPHATIIHCVRDPVDTCVSCFSKLFTTGHYFSYELGELGRFYRLYEKLMRHWHTVLPLGRMLEVRYEDVVMDIEGQARKLLTYCGLPWDDACLRFYEASRPVRTASLAQVRQPIYASSVGRWKRYEKYLDPLKQALAGKQLSRETGTQRGG
ncbi:MAG: sulfotransferase [Gammaproteobacteria bacterium]